MENNKLELEDLDKQLAAVLLAQEVVAEALKNNPSHVVLSRCKELLAAETKKLLLLEYRLYVGESVDEDWKSNSAESFELVGSVLKEATLMENEISQKLGEIPIDSSSEEVVPNSSDNDLSFQFHEIAKTVVNDFVKKNFVEESFKQVLLTLTHKLLMGNCLSSTVNSSRCLFDRGKYKLKFDSSTLRSLYCTGFQIVDRLYREIVQKLVYQSGYQSNGFSGDSIDCMLENEGFITTAWYLFGKMLECEIMRRLFDRGKNFEAINRFYFTIHLPQLQFTSAIDTSASFQYTRLIFDRGRYVRESKLLDKYTDDLISKLDSACGYCLQLLSANSNEFAFDVLPSFNYGCILFDGGKLPEIMFWNSFPKGSDVDCSYFYQYHTYTGEIYFWLVCMCANRGKCSYCVLKFTGKVFDRGRLLELIQIQYACELFHEILQQVNFHCKFEYTASHEGWLDQFRSQVYHPADEWSSQVIRVYKLEEGVPWFHVYSLMVVFFIIKRNGLLEISMIVTEQIFQLIANMGKASYKARIDEYLFIIIIFDRGKVLDRTWYFHFCCWCCVFDLRAQCVKPLSFDISDVHSHGLIYMYLHASEYKLLQLGTDVDVCFYRLPTQFLKVLVSGSNPVELQVCSHMVILLVIESDGKLLRKSIHATMGPGLLFLKTLEVAGTFVCLKRGYRGVGCYERRMETKEILNQASARKITRLGGLEEKLTEVMIGIFIKAEDAAQLFSITWICNLTVAIRTICGEDFIIRLQLKDWLTNNRGVPCTGSVHVKKQETKSILNYLVRGILSLVSSRQCFHYHNRVFFWTGICEWRVEINHNSAERCVHWSLNSILAGDCRLLPCLSWQQLLLIVGERNLDRYVVQASTYFLQNFQQLLKQLKLSSTDGMTVQGKKELFSVSVDEFKPDTRHYVAGGVLELNAFASLNSFSGCQNKMLILQFEGKLIMLVLPRGGKQLCPISIASDPSLLCTINGSSAMYHLLATFYFVAAILRMGLAGVNIISNSKMMRSYSQVTLEKGETSVLQVNNEEVIFLRKDWQVKHCVGSGKLSTKTTPYAGSLQTSKHEEACPCVNWWWEGYEVTH